MVVPLATSAGIKPELRARICQLTKLRRRRAAQFFQASPVGHLVEKPYALMTKVILFCDIGNSNVASGYPIVGLISFVPKLKSSAHPIGGLNPRRLLCVNPSFSLLRSVP